MKTFDEIREALSPAQKAAREKNRIGPKGEVGKREYGSDKAKRGFHKAQRGVSGKGDNRNTMSIFDRQPKTALQGNKPKGKLPEDSDAVKAFLAKGGKIKKLPPAKAQGYHGKDDPGKDVRGMLDKPDTKKSVMGTRKKAKSMGEGVPSYMAGRNIKQMTKRPLGHDTDKPREGMMSTSSGPFGINPKVGLRVMKKGKEVPPTPPKIGVVSYTGGKKDKLPPHLSGKKEDMIIRSKKPASKLRRDAESRPTGVREISKGMAARYLKKVPASAADAGRKSAGTTGIGPDDQKKNVEKGIRKFVNRQRGTSMAVDKMTGKAKVPAK